MTKLFKRRDILTGFTGFGIGSLLSFGLLTRKTEAAQGTSEEIDYWKYAMIDPVKAADLAHEIYPGGACMYACVRAMLTTVADALRPSDPANASKMMAFPFYMMSYGHAGIGGTGSTCGAFNGASAIISLFVKDTVKRDEMIQELFTYYEQTELPKYKPKYDKDKPVDEGFLEEMKTVKPESVLCHISSTRWRKAASASMFAPIRSERCRRLTADIVTKTAELLNRYHADHTCTFASLLQPTATCVECHRRGGIRPDVIAKMNCASCHKEGEAHNIEQINLVPPERRGILQQMLQPQK
jgi:hypothetical protein